MVAMRSNVVTCTGVIAVRVCVHVCVRKYSVAVGEVSLAVSSHRRRNWLKMAVSPFAAWAGCMGGVI